MLGDRRSAILGLIIEQYIKTGEPMGSKTLCQLLPYAVSSATVRNEMAYLSQLGLIEQRHTSGGRVPCKAAYRFYIDNLMKKKTLSSFETEKIDEMLSVNAGDSDRLLQDASKLLADATHCMSFYCTLEDENDCIQGVQLIPAGGGRAMLVMLTVGGRIESSICYIGCPIDELFLSVFYDLINQLFIGTPLKDVSLATIQNASIFLGERIFDMLPVLTSLCSLCNEASKGKLMFDGETNLLSHEELGQDVYKLLSFFTRRDKIKALLAEYAKNHQGAALLVGDENPNYEMKNTTTIIANYNYSGGQTALLGLVGSMRIDYETVLPYAEYIMTKTASYLKSGGVVNG